MHRYEETQARIRPVDASLAEKIQAHLDDLTKPRGSLGKLEEIALRYCLAQGTVRPGPCRKKIFCFAGDHGVAAENVSAYPSEVTVQMVLNMVRGGAAINVLSRHAGSDLAVVDLGVAAPLEPATGLIIRKVRAGTRNMARGPAMTTEEATQALEVGIELAVEAAESGYTLLGTGDMGIANTTPSTALYSVLLEVDPAELTGRGTGLDDAGVRHKTEVIRRAIEVNRAHLGTPLSTLAALGGLEIAGICGLILGASSRRVPVVVDGFISTAAAIVACQMSPAVRDYLFFSHRSQERGHAVVLDRYGVRPVLDLDLRLGEGTGAALAMMIIEAGLKICNEMATFSSAGVSREG